MATDTVDGGERRARGCEREGSRGERGADREGVRGGRGCRGVAEGDQGDEGVARQARRSWRGSPVRRARSCFGARGGRRRRVAVAGWAGQVGGAGPVLMDHQVFYFISILVTVFYFM